jgi:hypothetical protein
MFVTTFINRHICSALTLPALVIPPMAAAALKKEK